MIACVQLACSKIAIVARCLYVNIFGRYRQPYTTVQLKRFISHYCCVEAAIKHQPTTDITGVMCTQ